MLSLTLHHPNPRATPSPTMLLLLLKLQNPLPAPVPDPLSAHTRRRQPLDPITRPFLRLVPFTELRLRSVRQALFGIAHTDKCVVWPRDGSTDKETVEGGIDPVHEEVLGCTFDRTHVACHFLAGQYAAGVLLVSMRSD